MFNFVKEDNPKSKVSVEYIDEFQKKYNLSFPKILKDYYLQHNGADIQECSFQKKGFDFCVTMLRDLNYGILPIEKILEYNKNNEAIPNTFIPLALDFDDDDYYWDSKDGKVYYLCTDNVEHPIPLFDSVEEFFDTLNKCYE